MIGKYAELVKKVIMVSVSYHDGEAIAASLEEYTPNFELSAEVDLSDMLNVAYSGDTMMKDEETQSVELQEPLVKLKNNRKQN